MSCPITFHYDGPLPPLAVWEEYRRRNPTHRAVNPWLSPALGCAGSGLPIVPNEAAGGAIANARDPARPEPQPQDVRVDAVDVTNHVIASEASTRPNSPRSAASGASKSALGGAADLLASGGADAPAIDRLAKLSPMEYDRCRKAEAETLGVRVETLDALVRKRAAPEDAAAGNEVLFPELEPWPGPVPGTELLADLSATARRFVIMPRHAADAVALWVVFTYCIDAVQVAPILAVSSPEKRCGKSTLLSLLVRLTFRALPSSNITPSAVFRAIEAWSPTLVIDEADTFLRNSEEMRGVLNSGHIRDTAFVVRTVGDDFEPRRFSTWGAKAIALIGKLPDTLHDRAILIELRRKLRNEATEKLRHAQPGLFDELPRKCARFALDNAKAVAACRPEIPEPLHDRAGDNWEPLLAIAEVAGGDWPERARAAALALSGEDAAPASRGVELLADIRDIFAECGTDRIASATLIEALTGLEERPWADFKDGEPITPKNVAELLSGFGIRPKSIRIEDETPKGYLREQFEDALERYLPALPARGEGSQPPHRHNPISTGDSGGSASATAQGVLRMEDARKGPPNKACCGVAATSGGPKEVDGPVAIPAAPAAPNRPGERSTSTSKEPCA